MVTPLLFSQYLGAYCETLNGVIMLAVMAGIIGVYGFTLLRFSYLRYLYVLMQEASDDDMKMHKVLASVSFGIIGSIASGVIYAVIWVVIGTSYIYTHPYTDYLDNVMDVMYAVQVLVSVTIGIAIFMIDVAMNWKRIKEKGIVSFLKFDDPFHLRWDLLSMLIIFTCVIVVIIVSAVHPTHYQVVSGYMYVVSFFFSYQLAGFTAIIFEWVRWVRGKIEGKKEKKDEAYLEEIMRDETFFELFKSYCEKEFSLENAKLYEALMELENKSMNNNGMVSKEDFKQLYQTFFQSYSKYEVNIPSKVKKDLEQFLTQDVTPFQHLKESVNTDLFFNLKDTYDRLRDTNEYKRWSLSREIQLKQSVV